MRSLVSWALALVGAAWPAARARAAEAPQNADPVSFHVARRLDAPGERRVEGSSRTGGRVAIHGDHLAVLSTEESVDEEEWTVAKAEALRFFERRGGVWRPVGEVVLEDEGWRRDCRSLAMTDRHVVVGARGRDVGDRDPSVVEIYDRSANGWHHGQTLVQPEDVEGWYGTEVAIDGRTLAVGAPQEEFIGPRKSEVVLYELRGEGWELVQTLRPEGLADVTGFGKELALQGDVLAIGGARENDGRCGVHVYQRDEGRWARREVLTSAPAERPTLFGWSLDLDAPWLAVGAWRESGTMPSEGAVHLFHIANGRWEARQLLRPPVPVTDLQFGSSLALDGERLVVLAPCDRERTRQAVVHAYTLTAGAWRPSAVLVEPEPFAGRFASLALSGDAVAVGGFEGLDPASPALPCPAHIADLP